MTKLIVNVFKNESDYENSPLYSNNEAIFNEDITIKKNIPYEVTLYKNKSEKGTVYLSITLKPNEWAIENKDKYAHLKNIEPEIKETSKVIDDDIAF